MTLSRISITVPESLVHAADERARQLERSRSWVVVEALRTYLGTSPGRGLPRGGVLPPDAIGERAPVSYAAGLGAYRRAQLEADLRLTPEERVKEAEETARVAELRAPRARCDRVLLFDSYEDYLDWQREEDRRR